MVEGGGEPTEEEFRGGRGSEADQPIVAMGVERFSSSDRTILFSSSSVLFRQQLQELSEYRPVTRTVANWLFHACASGRSVLLHE